MAALTRRRSTDAREECWHIYYGDVRVGTIAVRSGNPHDTDPWQWSCGFYPGSHPGEHQDGTAATFDEARADFEKAWTLFLSKRTEADFQAWRDQQAWTAEKYRRFARGERMPPDGSRRQPQRADETPASLEAAVRRSHSPAPRSPARHPQRRRRIRSEASQGRAGSRGVAGRGRSPAPGRRAQRAHHDGAHWHAEGIEPRLRSGV